MPILRPASRRFGAAGTALLMIALTFGLGAARSDQAYAAPPVRTLPLSRIATEHGFLMEHMVSTKRRTFVSKSDQLWVLNPNGSVHRKIGGPSGSGELTLSPDGKRLYMVTLPGLYVWDTHTLKVLQRVELDNCTRNIVLMGDRIFYVGGRHCQTIKSVGALKRGHAVPTGIQARGPLVLAGGGSTLVVAESYYLPAHPYAPKTMSYRVKGSKLVKLADIERDGGLVTRIFTDREGRTVYIPSCCAAAEVTAYRATTLHRGATYTAEQRGLILSSLAISPDGRSFAMAVGDSPVDLVGFRVGSTTPAWFARTTAPDDQYRPRPVPRTLTYSEDGKRLLVLVSEPPHIGSRVSPLYLSSINA